MNRLSIKGMIAVAIIAIISLLMIQYRQIQRLKSEKARYQNNTEVLLSDIKRYKVKDSLSAAQVQSLELSLKEYKKFRSEDAELIKSLKVKNRDLASVNKTQAQTIIELRATAKDTVVIIKDSIHVPAMVVRCGDYWYDFEGMLANKEFSGKLHNRDSLVVAETIEYKRFLGFLWKTKKIKNRALDVVSKNPHTDILGIEYVVIKK